MTKENMLEETTNPTKENCYVILNFEIGLVMWNLMFEVLLFKMLFFVIEKYMSSLLKW